MDRPRPGARRARYRRGRPFSSRRTPKHAGAWRPRCCAELRARLAALRSGLRAGIGAAPAGRSRRAPLCRRPLAGFPWTRVGDNSARLEFFDGGPPWAPRADLLSCRRPGIGGPGAMSTLASATRGDHHRRGFRRRHQAQRSEFPRPQFPARRHRGRRVAACRRGLHKSPLRSAVVQNCDAHFWQLADCHRADARRLDPHSACECRHRFPAIAGDVQ